MLFIVSIYIYLSQVDRQETLLALGQNLPDFEWNREIWDVFQALCEEELSNDHIIVLKAARKGVICHSNKLPSLVRIAIERLMRSKPPKVIIATSTLGQGVNVGISTVIVASTNYDEKTRINNRDFWNVCGRAGRAFSDTEGKILYAIDVDITKKKSWQIRNDRSLAESYLNPNLERAASGLLFALGHIFQWANKAGVDFELLLEAIANDFTDGTIEETLAKRMKWAFDFMDDELLAMHQDFSPDGEDIGWVDDAFRESLAIIQAQKYQEEFIRILKARASAVVHKFTHASEAKKAVASGVPLSVAKLILDNVDVFRSYMQEYVENLLQEDTESPLLALDALLRKLELWINTYAGSCFEKDTPEQNSLDTVRKRWLSGEALSAINDTCSDAAEIAKDYYGFTVPWIIHAISQMFDPDADEYIIKLYTNLAMFVELGLPNETAANVYMAGVRSRTASLELSQFLEPQGKTVVEIKHIIVRLSEEELDLSEQTKVWLDLLAETYSQSKKTVVSFPGFTMEHDDLPSELYLHKYDGHTFLASCDGYFHVEILDTAALPFSKIPEISGLYFEREGSRWCLKSYNPMVTIKTIR